MGRNKRDAEFAAGFDELVRIGPDWMDTYVCIWCFCGWYNNRGSWPSQWEHRRMGRKNLTGRAVEWRETDSRNSAKRHAFLAALPGWLPGASIFESEHAGLARHQCASVRCGREERRHRSGGTRSSVLPFGKSIANIPFTVSESSVRRPR